MCGQPLRNFSYPARPHAGEIRFHIPDNADLDPAIERVRSLVGADPRVLADPAPSVLLDRPAGDALEIAVGFSTADDVAALVKSDVIKAVYATLDSQSGKEVACSV